MNNDSEFRKEINWQKVIAMRLNSAWSIRQSNPEQFRHGVAGAWNALWPELQERLAKQIGDTDKQEQYFQELLDEVFHEDLKNKFGNNVPKKKKIIRCCEYISRKIMKVLEQSNLLYSKRDRPTFGLRKRKGGD